MNLPYFISHRISKEQKNSFSSTIHKIAVATIGIGLATMIVSFLILKGFQETVKEKIFSFSSHIQVTRYTINNSYEEDPIDFNTDFYHNYETYKFVEHVQEYAHKAGLIKAKDEVLGVIFKGLGKSFDHEKFRENIIEGDFIDLSDSSYSKEVVVSKVIADKLGLTVEDDLILYFLQNPPRLRKLHVKGIYETNLSEYYDDKFVLGDIRLVQRLNDWSDSTAGGLEIFVKDINRLDEAEEALERILDYDMYVEKVSDKYIQVFEWLHLISRQVNIFLGIILAVVCVNMVSIILILIMERTQMIGLLKAFGAVNGLIRKIFMYSGVQLITKGLLIGNGLGLGVCAIQYFFRVIPLNPKDYYMSFVPIGWNWEIVLALNALTFVLVTLILIVPTLVISRINPIRSIRFD